VTKAATGSLALWLERLIPDQEDTSSNLLSRSLGELIEGGRLVRVRSFNSGNPDVVMTSLTCCTLSVCMRLCNSRSWHVTGRLTSPMPWQTILLFTRDCRTKAVQERAM
jgi:hypothetical protein